MFFSLKYLLFLAPPMLFAAWAAAATKSRFAKWGQVGMKSGYTGAQCARYLLDKAGLNDVPVEKSHGHLSDHYDPGARTVRLSPEVHDKASVSALAVAAHECGHAFQHQQGYAALGLRSVAIPFARFGSRGSMGLIMVGGFVSSFLATFGGILMLIGVFAFVGVIVFQLITLPVEFDASARAKVALIESGLAQPDEVEGISHVLWAAAMTYVAAVATSVVMLLFVLSRTGGRR